MLSFGVYEESEIEELLRGLKTLFNT